MSNKVRKIYLCRPNLKPLCVLNGVQTDSVNYSTHVKDFDELTFTVDRFVTINGKRVQSNGYEWLNIAMYVYLEDIGYFRMEYPAANNDGNHESKSVTAYSIEKETFNVDWTGVKINTAQPDSLEMIVTDSNGNLYNQTEYKTPINLISFYNPYDPQLSFLDVITSKLPIWKVGYVDPLIYMRTDDNGDFIPARDKSVVVDPTKDPDDETRYATKTFTFTGDKWDIDENGDFYCIQDTTWTDFQYELRSIGMYEQDNVSIYAFLTSVIAPKLECLIFFDTEKRLIHAISKKQLQEQDSRYDTGVFIGFRNLANSVDINVNEDSIITRLNCVGADDLRFDEINYGSSRLIDLSYFDGEPWMDQDLAEKVRAYQQWVSDNRAAYKQIAVDAANIQRQINDITFLRPSDEDYWKQWDEMNEEGLRESLALYQKERNALQESVDNNPQYDADNKYIPYNTNGTIDGSIPIGQPKTDQWYMSQLTDTDKNGYGGYATYYQIVTYIIPNIEAALNNLYLTATSDEKMEYIKQLDYDWDLYGINALQDEIKNLEQQYESLKKDYGDPWPSVVSYTESFIANGSTDTFALSRYANYVNRVSVGSKATNAYTLSKTSRQGADITAVKLNTAPANGQVVYINYYLAIFRDNAQYTPDQLQVMADNGWNAQLYQKNRKIYQAVCYQVGPYCRYVGQVEDYSSLILKNDNTGSQQGDIWKVTKADEKNQVRAGQLFVFNGESWNSLNSTMDLSDYAAGSGVPEKAGQEFGLAYVWLDALYEKRDGTDRSGNPISPQAVANSYSGKLKAKREEAKPYEENYAIQNWHTAEYPDGFTDEQLQNIYPLLFDTDYTNSNIGIQTTDDELSAIDKQQDLLDDCLDKISELCQPQISFTTNLENLYRIPEFENIRRDLKLMNYIHLGFRDDKVYKLRVVGISWNPCDITQDLTIEFSNMITTRSGRTDFTDILQTENNRGQKNSISIGRNGEISGTGDSSDYLSNLIDLLASAGTFRTKVKNIVDNPVGGSTGIANNVTAEELNYALKMVPGISRFVYNQATAATAQNGQTKIQGGRILTGFLNANYIACNMISSPNFDSSTGWKDSTHTYTKEGMVIDLYDAYTKNGDTIYSGSIHTPQFAVMANGDAYFGGDLNVGGGNFIVDSQTGNVVMNGSTSIGGSLTVNGSGTIGPWSFDSNKFTYGTQGSNGSFYLTPKGATNTTNIGGSGTGSHTWGLTLGSGFGVTTSGALFANGATISGTITSSNATITGGSLKVGSKFTVGTDGTLSCSGATISGKITATSGTIGGCSIENGALKIASANISSLSADKINGGTITASAINLNNGTFKVTTAGAVTASNIAITGGSMRINAGDSGDAIISITNTIPNTVIVNSTLSPSGLLVSYWNSYGNASSYQYASDGPHEKSDIRLKKNIQPLSIDDVTDFILSLNLVTFNYKDESQLCPLKHQGVIAQDVVKYFNDKPNNYVSKQLDGYYSVNYLNFVIPTIATVQKQNETIKQLNNKISELEKMIKDLTGGENK